QASAEGGMRRHPPAAAPRSEYPTGPPRTTPPPDFHRRYRSFTGSTSRWLRLGRGLSPPVRTFTDPGARVCTSCPTVCHGGVFRGQTRVGNRIPHYSLFVAGKILFVLIAFITCNKSDGKETDRAGGMPRWSDQSGAGAGPTAGLAGGGPLCEGAQVLDGGRRVFFAVDRGACHEDVGPGFRAPFDRLRAHSAVDLEPHRSVGVADEFAGAADL